MKAMLKGLPVIQYLFSCSIYRIFRKRGSCSLIEIILCSHDILYLRTILCFLQSQCADKDILIRNCQSNTFQFCQCTVCIVELFQYRLCLQIIRKR